MALTLGDINPDLQKKTALQLENERKAQERAKITSQRTYIGEGNDPAKMTAFAPKPTITDPGKNLQLVQQNPNNYMGPIQTMGQVNPALNQPTALQKKNQTPAQQENLSDLAKFARARNESMVNAGITPTPSGTPQPYDVKSAQAQPGYTPTLGGKVNIAPELFYNKYKATDPMKAQLEAKVAEAKSKYPGIVTDEASLQAYNEYQKALTDLREYSPTVSPEQQALAQRSAVELAQTGIGMTSGISTGDARFDSQLSMGLGIAQDDITMAQEKKKRMDELTKKQLINSYMQTNISDLGYNKQDLNKMSLEQLSALASADGLALSNELKDRLSANGKIQIENEKLTRDMQLADVEMTRRQLERNLGRAIQEREDFNTQQDTKLRRMLGMFAGGQVEDLAGNMAVMDYQEKGKQALEDLKVDFADRQDSLGRQYTAISQQYGNTIRMLENQVAQSLETAYADLMGKVDGYIAQGIKNEDDLASAITTAKRDYLKFYVDTTNKAADFMQKQNEMLFTQMITLQKEQRAEDEALSNMYGVVFRNSKPVIDQNGMQVPTFDMMQFNSQQDKFLSEQTGFVYQNGQPLLDARGDQIPTMSRMRLDQDLFGIERQMSKDQFDMMKTYAEGTGDYSQIAQLVGAYAGESYMPGAPESIKNSKYTPTIMENGTVLFNVPLDASGKIADTTRRQCGEYVNDAIGAKVFGNSIESKRQKITSQVPTPGSAFVQATSGPYGHVGLVEGVLATDEQGRPTVLQISDSNFKSANTFERTTVAITYDKNGNPTYIRAGAKPGKMKIEGFTDSFIGAPQPQAPTPAMQSAMDIMSPYSGLGLADIPQKERASVAKELNKLKQQAMQSGDLQGMIRASAGGKEITDTLRQSLAKAMRVDQELRSLEQTMSSEYTDPIIGIIRSNNPYDTKAKLIQAQLQSIIPTLARGVYGEVGVLTNQDIQNYIQTLPNLQSTEEVRRALLDMTKTKIRNAIASDLESAARANYNVSGFADIPILSEPAQQPAQQWGFAQMATTIKMRAPNGQTVYIPYDKLQEAIDAGATRL